MKDTTHPKLRPNPSARLVSEPRGGFALSPGWGLDVGSPEDEVELDGKDVDEPDADVIVVGSSMPK